MTAHAMKSDRDRCVEAGMDDYLPKPVSPAALAEVLTKWLQPDDSFKQESGAGAKSVAAEGFAPQLFDPDDFMNRMMDDIEMARFIIEGFLEMSPGLLTRLGAHIRQGETLEAGQTAHSLKGSAGNLSAPPLADLAFKMECAGKDGDIATLTALWPQIQRQFDQLADELTKWLSIQIG
jgi:two-component system, sensor histidine kinase and response regulator